MVLSVVQMTPCLIGKANIWGESGSGVVPSYGSRHELLRTWSERMTGSQYFQVLLCWIVPEQTCMVTVLSTITSSFHHQGWLVKHTYCLSNVLSLFHSPSIALAHISFQTVTLWSRDCFSVQRLMLLIWVQPQAILKCKTIAVLAHQEPGTMSPDTGFSDVSSKMQTWLFFLQLGHLVSSQEIDVVSGT